MRRPYGFATNLIGIKIGMVLTERRKKRDFDVLQDPRGAIVPAVPFLFPRSANYPEQCRVIKRNAFPDKLQIFRWKFAYYASEEFAAFWTLDSFSEQFERTEDNSNSTGKKISSTAKKNLVPSLLNIMRFSELYVL